MTRTKKVIITGGEGFIDSAVSAALQTCGHDIYVIDNLSFGRREPLAIPDSHFLEVDILDRVKLSRVRTLELGNLEPKRDFIHTTDMAQAIVKLLATCDRGIEIFNLGRGIEYSVTELVAAFEQELGEKIAIKVEPTRVRKVERIHLLADISKLKNFIDWEPNISLNQGISTLIDCKSIASML